MLEVPFSALELTRTRFAFSPIWEAVASMRVLRNPGEHALHLPWVKATRAKLDDAGLDIDLFFDLVPDRRVPSFLTVTPVTPMPDLADELAALRDLPAKSVRRALEHMDPPRSAAVARLHRNPEAGMERLADLIETYWKLALEPHWHRMRSLIEGDISYHARKLVEGGAESLLNDLSPMVSWKDGKLRVEHKATSLPLEGRGLVLVPSIFVWPAVSSKTDSHWRPVLRYPARGIATLWDQGGTATSEALAAVIGRTRAILLTELAAPASTTELAQRARLTAGGVSQHLAVLRAAGLVSAQRAGRSVLYSRTSTAEGLMATSGQVDC